MSTFEHAPHIPVLIEPLIARAAPIAGRWLDGTLGAGGYARALLDAGAAHVIGIDQDPLALKMAEDWSSDYPERFQPVHDNFANLADHGTELDGIVLDLGVSSMQLDTEERGFSFMRDGPLDMRMSQEGITAAELLSEVSEAQLADILFYYGEERASRRIARAILRAQSNRPVTTTSQLAEIISACLPRQKPGQSHPATRSFQALRIAVNREFVVLSEALAAAAEALRIGGILAVVSFHSLEDRMVKRFLQFQSGRAGRGNRYAPEQETRASPFELLTTKAIAASDEEVVRNPRARSAYLRMARRTNAPAQALESHALGMPYVPWGK